MPVADLATTAEIPVPSQHQARRRWPTTAREVAGRARAVGDVIVVTGKTRAVESFAAPS
ncbi:hypothetical protein [Streptomyces cahuitamycinicus]|uniref:hypothetical protein n=1 Tax=Streptomyces cahuitamycinicus TaxID=2070367 RepID=UPI0015E11304|nr:hypothetical protein [Streptomyces cahuitamycinicus]